MALVDATLSSTPSAAVLFFADFVDLPLRGAFAPCPIHVPTGLADSDVDCAGITFDVLDSKVLQVGTVSHDDGGNDTLGFTLQADPADTDLMAAIETPSLYVGRRVRVWLAIYNPGATTSGGATVTELRPLYRGYMTQPAQEADASSYIITMASENYWALLSAAQSRTYIQSTLYDAGDLAGAVIKGQSGTIPGAPGGGAGGNDDYYQRQYVREN
jgi:hypothetical protein